MDVHFHGEAMVYRAGASREHGCWVAFSLDSPEEAAVFKRLRGRVLRVTVTTGDIQAVAPDNETAGIKVARAELVRATGVFRKAEVLGIAGGSGDYEAWVRKQPCALDLHETACDGAIQAAHVRRAADAGTGFKPPWATIPLCFGHHTAQHAAGESSLVPSGKAWFDGCLALYLEQWAERSIVHRLGYNHLADVPIDRLREELGEHLGDFIC